MSAPLYRDPNASVEERVENLLALMTPDEKLAQLGCLWSTTFVSMGTFDPNVVAEQMPHGLARSHASVPRLVCIRRRVQHS